MKTLGIIPARYPSSRFPGKPLAEIGGIPMVVHVYRRSIASPRLDDVIVATDDQRIIDGCKRYDVPAMMTADTHQDCLDRAAEVARRVDADRYVIIQGDEPFFDCRSIDVDLAPEIIGFYTDIKDHTDIDNPNVVKVTLSISGRAMYFSRNPIPSPKVAGTPPTYYKQLGLYAMSGPALQTYTKLGESPLEKIEKVGLLRLLDHDQNIAMYYTEHDSMSIDTPEELEIARKHYQDLQQND